MEVSPAPRRAGHTPAAMTLEAVIEGEDCYESPARFSIGIDCRVTEETRLSWRLSNFTFACLKTWCFGFGNTYRHAHEARLSNDSSNRPCRRPNATMISSIRLHCQWSSTMPSHRRCGIGTSRSPTLWRPAREDRRRTSVRRTDAPAAHRRGDSVGRRRERRGRRSAPSRGQITPDLQRQRLSRRRFARRPGWSPSGSLKL
jgi:hypothetical protein